jgi:hypothetical protein
MIRIYLHYTNQIIKMNLVLSILWTIIISSVAFTGLSKLIGMFLLSFLSGGYILGVYYYEIARKKEYHFYYNLGISKLRLIITGYLIHLCIAFPFFLISYYARHT